MHVTVIAVTVSMVIFGHHDFCVSVIRSVLTITVRKKNGKKTETRQ